MAEGQGGGIAGEDGPNAAQVAYWNSPASAGWLAEQERFDALFAPLTETALDLAAPRPGERAVDVGCGCSATVLALAHRVGPGGGVLGLDVSARLVERARERIAEVGLGAHARVELADAALRPFAPEADLLFSRFGVMFFADPVAAFANLRRALRPDRGRMVFAAWRPMAENPWFLLPLRAARARVALPEEAPPEPGSPGPFAFDDPARVRGILDAAGWREVDIAPHDTALRLAEPGEVEEAARGATRVGPLARALAGAGEDTRKVAEAAAAEALRPHDGPVGVVFPARCGSCRPSPEKSGAPRCRSCQRHRCVTCAGAGGGRVLMRAARRRLEAVRRPSDGSADAAIGVRPAAAGAAPPKSPSSWRRPAACRR